MKKTTSQVNIADIFNKGYSEAGASYVRRALKEMYPNSGSAASDINDNNYTLRQRSRMLYMGAPIATSAILNNRTNVVGTGLRLKATVDKGVLRMTDQQAEDWQKKTELEFSLWANRKQTCDAIGLNDFYELQQLVLMSWLLSGDVFILFKRYPVSKMQPYSLRLHLIEADRVRTPATSAFDYLTSSTIGKTASGRTIYDGVEVDGNGQIVAYHIANFYPYEISEALKQGFTRVEAYGKSTGMPNILHVMEAERPDQYRGVPYLAKVIEPLLQMRRYTNAEIMSAVVQSFFSAFLTMENPDPDRLNFNETGALDQEEISSDPNEFELGPGTVGQLKPGEDIKLLASSHPNQNFDAFMSSMCKQIGGALELPAEMLLKAFNSNYSAARAALLEAWNAFKMRRTWLSNDFCNPVYETWLTEAVARGRISAPGFLSDPIIRQAYLKCQWIGPSQNSLDPTKDLQASILSIENGLSTHEQEAIQLNGSEFAANISKLKTENELLSEIKTQNQAQNAPNFDENTEEIAQKTEEKTGENEEK